jgi:ribosomal protein S18 acetylase RimI-like enzyme
MATTPHPSVHIRPAKFPEDREVVSALFLAYEQFILDFASLTLDFQNFANEVASLPGKYAQENRGALYIAYLKGPPLLASKSAGADVPIGCVGLRAFSEHSAELKRVYLSPESRGLGVGRMLVDVAIGKARELGYGEILLDTLGSMTAARGLYVKCGFVEMESYYESVSDAVFYRLRL